MLKLAKAKMERINRVSAKNTGTTAANGLDGNHDLHLCFLISISIIQELIWFQHGFISPLLLNVQRREFGTCLQAICNSH